MHHGSQSRSSAGWGERGGVGADLIVLNPKLKLLDQVREVLRLRHYPIRTEQTYCDWIRVSGFFRDSVFGFRIWPPAWPALLTNPARGRLVSTL